MIVTIVFWVVAVVLLLPALGLLYFIVVEGRGGGKLLDLLIGVAVMGSVGGCCLYQAIQRSSGEDRSLLHSAAERPRAARLRGAHAPR